MTVPNLGQCLGIRRAHAIAKCKKLPLHAQGMGHGRRARAQAIYQLMPSRVSQVKMGIRAGKRR